MLQSEAQRDLRLPQELIDKIIDVVYEERDYKTLLNLSTVSSAFATRSQAYIYRNVFLSSSRSHRKFHNSIIASPRLASIPRAISIRDLADQPSPTRWDGEFWLATRTNNPHADTKFLHLLRSLPNLGSITLIGNDHPIFRSLPIDDIFSPHSLSLFRDGTLFHLPGISKYCIRGATTSSCHMLFTMFLGGSVKELLLEGCWHASDGQSDCILRTRNLGGVPQMRLALQYLSFEPSQCILEYLLHPSCVIDLPVVSSLRLSLHGAERAIPLRVPYFGLRTQTSELLRSSLLQLSLAEIFKISGRWWILSNSLSA